MTESSDSYQPRADGFSFHTATQDGHARTGVLTTPHATCETPIFMPVGTQGSVKSLTPSEVARTGAKVILGNTYHLWLRPGADLVERFGGLHEFSRWPHAMLTDSGGYQAFSLGAKGPGARGDAKVAMQEEGVEFRSHLDGSKRFLSPEEAVRVQAQLGADIQMQLDVCPEGNSGRDVVTAAIERTTRWAKRALKTPRKHGQALFGIVQGACFADLRRRHAAELAELPFDGIALGGFSVGEPIENMHATLAEMAHEVAPERPRYLMGVGTPKDLLAGIAAGIDMFDCVLPTRNARNGQLLTRHGKISIKQARFREDRRPIDASCSCEACTSGYSRAYLRHLFIAGEILPLRLFSLHNLTFYGELMAGARDAIRVGTFAAYQRTLLASMAGDGNDAAA
jgi:queuine tRNA-ribosyltransferase